MLAHVRIEPRGADNTSLGSNHNREETSIMADFPVARISKKFLDATAGAVAALCIAWTMAADAAPPAGVELALGQMRGGGRDWAVQVVSVKNNNSYPLESIYVECGFFQGGQLVSAGKSNAYNVASGVTAFLEVNSLAVADKAQCRVDDVHR
jgi:hypothetical protein